MSLLKTLRGTQSAVTNSIRNVAIPQFSYFLQNNFIKESGVNHKLSIMHKETSMFCKNNTNILFTRADKGNVTVAMYKEFYINKVEDLYWEIKIIMSP